MDTDENHTARRDENGDSGEVVAHKKRRNRVDPDFEQFELFLRELKECGEEGQRAEAGEIHRRWFTDEGYLSSLIRISTEVLVDSLRFLPRCDLSIIALVDRRFLRLIDSSRLPNVQSIPRLHIEMFTGRIVVDGPYHGRFEFDVSAALDNPPPVYVRFRRATINYTFGEGTASAAAKALIRGADQPAELVDHPSTSRAQLHCSPSRRGQTSSVASSTKNESDVAQHFLTSSSITRQFHGCELELHYSHSLPAAYIDGLLARGCFSQCKTIALTIRGAYDGSTPMGPHLPILAHPALLNCATLRLNVRGLLSRIGQPRAAGNTAGQPTRPNADGERHEAGERRLMERFLEFHRRLGRGLRHFGEPLGDNEERQQLQRDRENRQRLEERARAIEARRRHLLFAREAMELVHEEEAWMVEDDDALDEREAVVEEMLVGMGEEHQLALAQEMAMIQAVVGRPPMLPAPAPRLLSSDDLLERYIGARDLLELLHHPLPGGAIRRVNVMQVGVDVAARSLGELLRERFEHATEPLPYVLNFPNIRSAEGREREPEENEATGEEFSSRRADNAAENNDGEDGDEGAVELGRVLWSRGSFTYRRLPKRR